VERWNGSTWAVEEVPSPLGPEWTQLDSVSCTSASSCVAIGNSQTEGPIAEVWNGAHWDLLIPPHYGPQGDELDSVSCVSATYCEAVGRYTDAEVGYEHTLAMNWNGSTWSAQSAADPTPPGPNANNSVLTGISCTSETACVAVGAYWDEAEHRELTLAERWNGSNWSLEAPPNPDPTGDFQNVLTGVSCSGPSTCVAVGTYWTNGSVAYESSGIIADSFNGSSWTMQNPPNAGGAKYGDFNKVSCVSATFCLATTALFGPIYEWNGSSWTGSESTLSEVGASISCASETYCMAVGEGADLYSG
jgi:hypothetical protein